MALTNNEFAERVGCDFTTASRYRSGERLPSYPMLERIAAAFDLDIGELASRCALGAVEFSTYLHKHVFDVEAA